MVRSSHGVLVLLKRFPHRVLTRIPHRVLTRIPHHGLTGIPHRNPLFDRFRGCATVRLRKPLLRSDIRDIEGIVYGFKQPMGQMTTSSVFRRYAYSSVATTTITTILCKLRSAGNHIFVRLNVKGRGEYVKFPNFQGATRQTSPEWLPLPSRKRLG